MAVDHPPPSLSPRPVTEPAVPVRVLRRAADEGLITRDQLARLLQHAGVRTAGDAPPADVPPERPSGFDIVHVAYYAGASLVLFAFGWFLVDRWELLGPAGVLGVAVAYAALFLVLHVRLAREGLRVASGLTLLLAVGMTPLAAWAAQEWLLPLDPAVRATCRGGWGAFFACRLRWVAVELATVLAALFAMRRVRFAPLALPAAVALFFLAHHLAQAAYGWPWGETRTGWSTLAASSLLLAVAYGTDRREAAHRTGGPLEDDHAAWFFLPALVTGAVAIAELWGQYRELRHLMPLVALTLAAGALWLRRRLLLGAAALALLQYLGFLAFDVFRDTLAFPLLLAAFGIAVIALAVALQRLAPRLARAGPAPTRDSPAAWAIVLAPAVLALLMGPEARRRDVEQAANWRVLARQQSIHQKTLDRQRARSGGATPAPPPRGPGAARETRRPRGA